MNTSIERKGKIVQIIVHHIADQDQILASWIKTFDPFQEGDE